MAGDCFVDRKTAVALEEYNKCVCVPPVTYGDQKVVDKRLDVSVVKHTFRAWKTPDLIAASWDGNMSRSPVAWVELPTKR